MASRTPGPWRRPTPKRGDGGLKLSPAQVEEARARARAAGRRYPNLVDNMHVAAKARREDRVGDVALDEAE
ncbi:hypothetical protein PE064_16975 [Pseudoxanthomonas mexicana]|nr:hypothetical protein [Pseudoxanthomonas mexicana]WBX93348.1 hypothetical protein PE064_16975 [Pseudoxanthomonas mexicana]